MNYEKSPVKNKFNSSLTELSKSPVYSDHNNTNNTNAYRRILRDAYNQLKSKQPDTKSPSVQ